MESIQLGTEVILQKIEEPHGSLDVGKRLRWSLFQILEKSAALEHGSDLTRKLRPVVFEDAIEIHDLSVYVIQDLDFRGFFGEKESGSTGKRLHIDPVIRDEAEKGFDQVAFPAYEGQRFGNAHRVLQRGIRGEIRPRPECT